jgi:hypothetical protein
MKDGTQDERYARSACKATKTQYYGTPGKSSSPIFCMSGQNYPQSPSDKETSKAKELLDC